MANGIIPSPRETYQIVHVNFLRTLRILAYLAGKMEYWTAKFGPAPQQHAM
jgi:hypothetical protein